MGEIYESQSEVYESRLAELEEQISDFRSQLESKKMVAAVDVVRKLQEFEQTLNNIRIDVLDDMGLLADEEDD